jgi:hypothetical protein
LTATFVRQLIHLRSGAIRNVLLTSTFQLLLVIVNPTSLTFSAYTTNGSQVTVDNRPKYINAPDCTSKTVVDVVLTRSDGLVCTRPATVVAANSSGCTIKTTNFTSPSYLSVYYLDDTIYLADKASGIHKSVDGGLTWNNIFLPPENSSWQCQQVIRVTVLDSDNCNTALDKHENLWIVDGFEQVLSQPLIYIVNWQLGFGNNST